MNFFKEEPSVLHVYQNTVGGALLFYSPIDYLVFYSVFSVCVRQFRVKILGLCLMVDHIHVLFAETDLPRIRRFMQSCTSRYSRSFNNSLGKGGPLFNEGFSRAAKRGMKKIRTAIAYLYNNPVEKNSAPVSKNTGGISLPLQPLIILFQKESSESIPENSFEKPSQKSIRSGLQIPL